MKQAEVESLFHLAEIKVHALWRLQNRYYGGMDDPGEAFYKVVATDSWWLALTDYGLIEIGWRKRVIHIDWTWTSVRAVVTTDTVTKDSTHVHAWSVADALKYLCAFAAEAQKGRVDGPQPGEVFAEAVRSMAQQRSEAAEALRQLQRERAEAHPMDTIMLAALVTASHAQSAAGTMAPDGQVVVTDVKA